MRKTIMLLLGIIIMFSCITGTAHALLDTEGGWLPEKSEDAPVISFSNSFLTKYIWRGWNLGDEPVWQMDTAISWYGFTFDFWTNYTLNDEKGRDVGYQEYTEIDYTIDYTFNIGEMGDTLNVETPEILDPLSISAGYIYYTFPALDRDDKFYDTHEVYFSAAYDCLLQPYFAWYWDVGRGKGNSDGGGHGSYYEFGIGHTFDFEEDLKPK